MFILVELCCVCFVMNEETIANGVKIFFMGSRRFIYLLLFAFGLAQFSLFAGMYEVESVIKLGGGYHPTSVLKINDKGNVIGLRTVNGKHEIFFYDYSNKTLVEINSINTKHHVYPLDFNDNDTIIGYTDVDEFDNRHGRIRQTHVIQWKNFAAKDLTPVLGVVEVKSNRFLSINNSESLAGFGFDLCNQINSANHGKGSAIIVHTPSRSRKISASFGRLYTRLIALNEKGDAAGGVLYGDTNYFGIGHGGVITKGKACLWNSVTKKIIVLENLSSEADKYSFATNLNDKFQAVGAFEVISTDSRGQFFWHAFFWENHNFIDLGTLEPAEDSTASAINNVGEVVGISGGVFTHSTEENRSMKGFYWTKESGITDLNTMIDRSTGWNIVGAKDINNQGQIVAFAIKDGCVHVVILSPER